MSLLLDFLAILKNLRPEIVARNLEAVKLYTITEIICIRSFNLRTGIGDKTLCFEGTNWKAVEVYSTEWPCVKRSTQLSFSITSTPAKQNRQENVIRRLERKLFQVFFPKNPWLNTCLQLDWYVINISHESISILILGQTLPKANI